MVMSLAKKMYVSANSVVPCVNLAPDVELDDIKPWSAGFDAAKQMVFDGKAASVFVFVENSKDLASNTKALRDLWAQKVPFWLFYPKKPHLNTDLGRDSTWALMQKMGMKGTRQVGIDQLWSCLYFKNSAK